MNQEYLEYLHESGKMPSWAYYQQNGKSAQHNYNEQREKMLGEFSARVYIDKEETEKELKETVENVLDDLLKGLKLD